MDRIAETIDGLEYILDSHTKRHLVGGLLLSVSSLFFGLAITIITMKPKKESEYE